MPHLHLSPHPMDPSSAQTLLESPKTLAQKSGFIVRCYRCSDDLDRIRNMFVQSTLHGPVNVAMSWFAPRIVTACSSCAVGLASLWVWSVNPTNVSKFIEVIGESPFPAWIAGAVSTASALTAAYFWYRQRKVHEMFQIYMKDALENDLNDVPTIFGLRSHDGSPECFPSGSSGFWIAEEGEKIIGFVGLQTGVSEEERIGEVRRMVVSPSHRRRGVGKKLMDAVDKHAKASGIVALELTTSDYNVGALKMYNKCGWRLKRRRIYEGILLHVLRKDL